jgi:hypothetical protein
MHKFLRCIALPTLICTMATGTQMENSQQASVLPEVRSLLDVISRLAPVNVAVDSSGGEPPISICFEDRKELRAFTGLLRDFRGNFQWIPVSRLPYVCVVPAAEKRAAEIGVPQLRRLAAQDIGALAKFVERELHLEGVPSQGVTIAHAAKPTGEIGRGGPALLVAEPRQYLSNGFVPTSSRDRAVEYWISDGEGDLMYDKLHPLRGTASGSSKTALLERVCESKYEDVVILPSQVSALREECQRVAQDWPDLKGALDRIARVCDIALTDGLGIVVLGK